MAHLRDKVKNECPGGNQDEGEYEPLKPLSGQVIRILVGKEEQAEIDSHDLSVERDAF